MNRLLIVGTLIISTAPLLARGQQPNVAKLKADARNVVGVVGADKAKNQTHCKMMDLSWQMNEAAREKGQKKRAKTPSEEIVQLEKRLPEFVALMNGLAHVDPRSPDGREVALIIESLAAHRRRNAGRTSSSCAKGGCRVFPRPAAAHFWS